LTRARDLAGIFNSTIVPTASYDLDGIIDQSLAKLPSDSNADGGTVSSSTGILEGGIYSIIEDNNIYTYNGGTV